MKTICPQCKDNHELSQCPRWRVPPAQRGMALVTLLIYIGIASACVGVLYGAYRWVDGTWQTSAGINEGKRLEHAVMQPKLDICGADLADASLKLATQSASIAAAASAARAQADLARRQAAEARAAQADTRTEIQRLGDALRAGPAADTTCPAGSAVNKIREGLR